jgi:Holliday junction DNA helicase RuvA
MIDFIRGTVVELSPDGVVVSVGGVGLRLLVPPAGLSRLPRPGAEVTLHTHLQVREDALTLYGFLTREERDLFVRLLTVNGVGPKLALGALSALPAQRLAAVIAAGDVDTLARLPGIGRKTAQRIVLDLKGKLAAPGAVAAAPTGVLAVAAEALRSLGYTQAEIAAALATLPQDEDLTEEEAVRRAFQAMGSR